MKKLTERARSKGKLSEEEVSAAATALLTEEASDEEKADFLEALNLRGEHPSEVRAFASHFLAEAVPFALSSGSPPALDVCGTGGDKLGLFNISTTVMFVAAGAGARVVKHGNRGITSQSGGADVLEALGVPVDLPPEALHAMLESAGACFLFAPRFHPAFKAVVGARKILGARGRPSIFNMLGPLLNPARPAYQLTGVFAEQLVPLYSEVLPGLGREHAWVVHGRVPGGVMDEISTLGPTRISAVNKGVVSQSDFDPSAFFDPPAALDELRGGDAAANAEILVRILEGEKGPRRDIVVLNAAAALQVARSAANWPEAVDAASASIDSGAAGNVLAKMRKAASAV